MIDFHRAVLAKTPSFLNRSPNPWSHVQSNIVTYIVTSWIPENSISVVGCHQASFVERGIFERILHQVRDFSNTLCSLDIDVRVIHSCEVCVLWNSFKILLCHFAVYQPVARFIFENCRATLICVVPKPTLAFSIWVHTLADQHI